MRCILIKHSCSLIFTSINKELYIRRDESTVLSFKLSIFREGRAIPVGNQPSTECRWVAALQTSDYVGSASNCVGDMSRTMPADSLLTLYSVDSVNSFLSLTSRHDNPPQNASSNLCFSPRSSCGRSSCSVWRRFLSQARGSNPPL